jgi:hypothetical protein
MMLKAVLIIAMVLLIGCAPVSGVTIEEHRIGRMTDSGSFFPSLNFTRDEVVISEVRLAGVAEGDQIRWEFAGPGGMVQNDSQVLYSGQRLASSRLELGQLPLGEVAGSWSLAVFLNGVETANSVFEVRPLTGLAWWGPITGTLLLLAGIIVMGGIIVLFLLTWRKKSS